jgi:HK97 gp10 family phage protein
MAQSTANELPGTADYVAALKQRAKFTSTVAIRKALRAGGNVLLEAERAAAPVIKPGTAGASSLPPEALRDGLRMYSRDYEGEPQVVVGPNGKTAHVAAFVELGHAEVVGKGASAKVVGEVQAYPWIRPAYESSIGGVEEAMVDSMKESLKKGGV